MKLTTLLLLLSMVVLGASCTSEYEEQLMEGAKLKERLTMMESTKNLTKDQNLDVEIEKLRNEITYLAKVSGNEELFMKELFGSYNLSASFGSQK